jgi:hypothetical protein
MPKKLKLYVWHGVLADYTSGVMFALARSPEEARDLLLKDGNSFGPQDAKRWEGVRFDGVEPKEYAEPVGFYLYGGS